MDATSADTLSVIVPAYNEQEVLPEFHRRVTAVLEQLSLRYEVIYVNDGSSDTTRDVLEALHQHDGRVAIVDLSRNFGKEVAITAGLDAAKGDAAVIIDADLQDPPEVIHQLVHEWRQGYDVVYAKRTAREGETFVKKATAAMFYALIGRMTHIQIPANVGDFRLLSRRAIDAVTSMREQHRFMKGLFAWIGYRQKEVLYRRQPRFSGNTKWNYWRLWNFALEGITSFTTAPLKIATYLGLLTAAAAFCFGTFIILKTAIYGNPVPGYPSLLVVILFIGGIQLLAIGLIGEYLGRMFDETKRRPLYLVNTYVPSALSLLSGTE